MSRLQLIAGALALALAQIASAQPSTIVAWGREHRLALRSDGSIEAWGRNDFGQCEVPEPNTGFVAVASGDFHSLARKADGSIVAWGRNDQGQCSVPAPNLNYTALSGGGAHSLGIHSQ